MFFGRSHPVGGGGGGGGGGGRTNFNSIDVIEAPNTQGVSCDLLPRALNFVADAQNFVTKSRYTRPNKKLGAAWNAAIAP